ncbi:glycoside hydrolase family 3 N-terminal domain-containing protein [Amorphus sp. 3PC139-8]|uniref:glycoside hydrolase family 3 N-terminal domain-containing protein n=1 Tax=Amorphus sp. 3PC139-8 TaxID=2735676 RepID=UPI00345CA160
MTDIDALISAMTLSEKLGQLTMDAAGATVTGPGGVVEDPKARVREGRAGSLLNLWHAEETATIQRIAAKESRLKIPLLLGFDVVHGHRTIFPIPLGEAAAFDRVLWEETARVAAEEAAEDGLHLTFAPMLDIARDPRWGRMAEGPGEDPLVASRFAAAKVRGFQGGSLADPTRVAATAKHFCAYGAATAGRDYASVDISLRTLREVYLPPFEAAIEAGAAAIMPAFNDIAGVPMTAHAPLLSGWLRGEAEFDGIVVSDYHAIAELMAHGVAGDLAEAAALALKAGVDIDMMGFAYERGLPAALERGLVELAEIETAVRRVLELKRRLGLFQDPYRRIDRRAASVAADRRALAREAACRSLVLLKNDDDLLPLTGDLKSVAVLGPLAAARAEMRGPWSAAGDEDDPVTVVEGLEAALPACRVLTASGCGIETEDADARARALALSAEAELVVLCLGEAATMSGEAASRADPSLPEAQRRLAEAVIATGKPVVVVLFSGRPLVAPWLFAGAVCVLAAWFPGAEAGHAIADVLVGRVDPGGRLPVTWPRGVGQIPIFYAQRPSGRPANPVDFYTSKYLDAPVAPQFPFGHGLSYGRFRIEQLQVTPKEYRSVDTIEVSVAVVNEGDRAGEDTVFLFVRDLVASIARPLLELKDFVRVALDPGERDVLQFRLPVADLGFLGPDLTPCLEPGTFEIAVGRNADAATLLRTTVQLRR